MMRIALGSPDFSHSTDSQTIRLASIPVPATRQVYQGHGFLIQRDNYRSLPDPAVRLRRREAVMPIGIAFCLQVKLKSAIEIIPSEIPAGPMRSSAGR
jgi:hypothetical protein